MKPSEIRIAILFATILILTTALAVWLNIQYIAKNETKAKWKAYRDSLDKVNGYVPHTGYYDSIVINSPLKIGTISEVDYKNYKKIVIDPNSGTIKYKQWLAKYKSNLHSESLYIGGDPFSDGYGATFKWDDTDTIPKKKKEPEYNSVEELINSGIYTRKIRTWEDPQVPIYQIDTLGRGYYYGALIPDRDTIYRYFLVTNYFSPCLHQENGYVIRTYYFSYPKIKYKTLGYLNEDKKPLSGIVWEVMDTTFRIIEKE